MGLSTTARSSTTRAACLLALAGAFFSATTWAQPPAQLPIQPPAQPPAPLPPGAIEATKPKPGAQPAAPEKVVREHNAGGYKLDAGPIVVSEVPGVTLKDTKRNKDVEVRIRYSRLPANVGPYPIVIVSHGAGGSSMAFNDLCRLIASHGYIVLSPAHSDSIRLRKKNKDELGIDAQKEIEKLADKVDPMDRLADVELILNSLDYLSDFVPDLKDAKGNPKMDRSRIAIMGHSAGAYTAQLAMGARVRKSPDSPDLASYADPRIKAGILISPQSTGSGVLTKDSWSELSLPMLVVTGAQESTPGAAGFSKETPLTRREPFDLARPGDKFLIFIQGATHSSFAGQNAANALGEKPETDVGTITDTLASGVIAFLDDYLKQDKAAKDYLAGDGIKTVSQGKATLEHK